MLLDKEKSAVFLSFYKSVMTYLNEGKVPDNIEKYASLRPLIFERIDEIYEDLSTLIGSEFVESLRRSVIGKFIYLKKYKNGYILQKIDTGSYYQVLGLTTPLDDLVAEYSVIETAVIPFLGKLVCDGLIVGSRVSIGKNIAKEVRSGYWHAKKSGELIVNA